MGAGVVTHRREPEAGFEPTTCPLRERWKTAGRAPSHPTMSRPALFREAMPANVERVEPGWKSGAGTDHVYRRNGAMKDLTRLGTAPESRQVTAGSVVGHSGPTRHRIVGGGPSVIKLVRVLGNVCAVAPDGDIVEIPSVSQRRLLGLLALHTTQRLRTDWLADVLEISPGALRRSVSRLRTVLGPDSLVTATTGYTLTCDVDAVLFCNQVARASDATDRMATLQRAVGLWGGAALEEFDGEGWARGEIARLTEIHGAAVDDLADELISAHRPEDAIALLESQIARYPYRDRPRGLLIRALALAGRQADALRGFQNYRSVLADELGTEPSPEVVRIERRVATGWDGASSETGTDDDPWCGRFSDPGTALSERSLRGSICGARGTARRTGAGGHHGPALRIRHG